METGHPQAQHLVALGEVVALVVPEADLSPMGDPRGTCSQATGL
jgi:hypothetical protein